MPEEKKVENAAVPFSISAVKKQILKDLGASDEILTQIRSNEEIDEYKKYLESKKVEPKEEPVFKKNAGVDPSDKNALPPPEAKKNGSWNEEQQQLARYNMQHPSRALRWNDNARVFMIFDNAGNPRVF